MRWRASARERPRRRGPGALFLLTTLFVASAGLRMVDGSGAELRAALQIVLPAQADASGGAGGNGGDAVLPDVISALQAREAELERRERALEERRRALEIAEAEVRANLVALAEAEEALRATIALADGAAQDDLDRLTRVYETMKPKEAAALFETMDPNFAAGFLAQMSPAAAGAIMEGLPPEVAYTVSLVLAGRNMRVPSE